MELESEVKVPGLECNRSLHKGVLFVNNMVIKEPEYGIFFTDVFDDRILGNNIKQQQDEVINKINTLWKVVSEKLDNTPTRSVSKNFVVYANVVSHNHQENGAPSKKGNIKDPSKLLAQKYQEKSSLGGQDGNFPSPKRVHFVNTMTIIKKEDEPKETRILEPNAIERNDRNITVEVEEMVEKESRDSKTIVEEGESSDIGCNDETSNLGDKACKNERKIGEEGELIEYDQPLDLVNTRDELVYETLIEKMSSYSLNFYFRIKKGDPSNLKVPCMIGQKGLITLTYGIKEVTFKTPYKDPEMEDLTSEGHDLLSSRVILSDNDFRRGCESPLDLEDGFYKDVDKRGPYYNWKIERLDLKGPLKPRIVGQAKESRKESDSESS
ncbi:hypothetical protein Tco_0110494 [Tanacetum coccineum]